MATRARFGARRAYETTVAAHVTTPEPEPVVFAQRGQRLGQGTYAATFDCRSLPWLLGPIEAPLLLGSSIGLCFVPVFAAVLAVRAVLEERTLAQGSARVHGVRGPRALSTDSTDSVDLVKNAAAIAFRKWTAPV
jgi:hypothetical protein